MQLKHKTRGVTAWGYSLLALAIACIILWTLITWYNHRRNGIQISIPKGEIRIPILSSSALQTLDPIKSAELVQYNLDLQIFECLISVGRSGEIEPALAKKWTSSEDFTEWTFYLRNSKFADDPCFPTGKGRTVTTNDVVYSWLRGLDPKVGSLNSWALSTCVIGAEAYAKGEIDHVEGFEVVNQNTLRIHLTQPDRGFLARLTVLSTAIVPQEAIEHYGEQFGLHPVGTGPFKLKEWVQGESILLENNPNFGAGDGWQPKSPSLNAVRFIFFRSESQIANAFSQGLLDVRDVTGADLVHESGLASIDKIQEHHPDVEVIRPGKICRLHLIAPLIGPEYAFGNSSTMRCSLAKTYDHKQLSVSALGPLGTTTKTLVLPPGILLDVPENIPERKTIVDPSVDLFLQGRNVKVAYVSSRVNDVVVELLRKWLEDRGASVRFYPSSSINALFASVGEIKPDLTVIYWSPYYPDMRNYITALLSSSRPVPNFTGFSNEDLDRSAIALQTARAEKRSQVFLKINEILNQEMPWIPLYYETPLVLTKSRVQNYSINPVSVVLLSEVRLDDSHSSGEDPR